MLTGVLVMGGAVVAPAMTQDLACIVMTDTDPAARPSPLDSVTFSVGSASVKVCYGRPSAKGRTMIGGAAVPYGKLWRTGANEPTMIHTSAPIIVAGIAIDAGSYSMSTVPGEEGWEIVLNRSITQWGHERYYTGEVAEAEIARAAVESNRGNDHVETFTIRAEGTGATVTLILEWEDSRVTVPIRGA
jgi:hypothetical protein